MVPNSFASTDTVLTKDKLVPIVLCSLANRRREKVDTCLKNARL